MNAIILGICISAIVALAQANADSITLQSVGSTMQTVVISGTLSAKGEHAFQGIPFEVEGNSAGAYLLTMGGPFGITSARMYATADTFVMVNYLQQEVWHGNPNNPSLMAMSHFPLPASQLIQLMRGCVPGDPSRFSATGVRGDCKLYTCADSAGIEYVLVDTTLGMLKQYQQKDSTGALQMDVSFQNVQIVSDVPVAHTIVIRSNSKKQEATVLVNSITINEPLPKPLSISVPDTYYRRHFP